MNKILQRFSKASKTYHDNAFVQKHMGERLFQLLPDKKFQNILEIGCGSGSFSELLVKAYPEAKITLNDLSPQMLSICKNKFALGLDYLEGDAQFLNFPGKYDLICSCACFQWFSDLEQGLNRLKSFLSADGVLACAVFGSKHFYEVKSLSGVGLNYPKVSELEHMLDALGFESRLEEENILVHFKSVSAMLRHFKETGISAISSKIWTRGRLLSFMEAYEHNYKDESGIRLSWNPVYAVCNLKS